MSVSEPEPPPGSADFIGDYQVLEILGQGGMGEVFLAWDERLQRRVAIKRIRQDGEVSPTLRQRLLREAQAVASLSHPAIVHVYELLQDDAGDDCIVMEYVEGRTVAATLEGGPLDPLTAVHLAMEIAAGLAAAHEAGIVHRDLKAENVVVTPSGHARILDFGLAKPLVPADGDPTLTMSGLVLGTCRSMSPEQAKGAEVDGRSDLFSLGVLLYEMLTGQSPFRGSGVVEVLAQVISKDPPRVDAIRPAVPPRLGTLIQRLMEKEPASRPHSAAEVVHELEAIEVPSGSAPVFSPDETISELPTGFHPLSQPLPKADAVPVSTAEVNVSSHNHRRLRIAVLILLGIAVLVGIVLLIWFLKGRDTSLRVVVLAPEVHGKDERLQLAALAVLTASHSTLNSLDGVITLDSEQILGAPDAKDEVLGSILDETGSTIKITLYRSRGANEKPLWKKTFSAPIDAKDLLRVAQQVEQELLQGYSDHRPRRDPPLLKVREQDFADFLEIQRDIRTAGIPNTLPRLSNVIERSPDFLEARRLAANLYMTLFESDWDGRDLDRAEEVVRKARELAPEDIRLLFTQFRVEMLRGRISDAEKTFEQLTNLKAGDQLLLLKAKLDESRGQEEKALEDLESLVRQRPSWENIYFLADFRARTGHIEKARNDLDLALSNSPDNLWLLEKRATIELLYGDLEEAEERYRQLIEKAPSHRPYYTNRGNTLVLLGRNQEAIDAFNKALSIDSDNVAATVSLADAELALGRERQARDHYGRALDLLTRKGVTPSPRYYLAQAQCLAHLDEIPKALGLTKQALKGRPPDDGDVRQQVALIYALARNKDLTLRYIEEAVEKGVQPRWFQLPAYGWLENDPEYQRLLKEAGGHPEGRPPA